MKLPRFSRGAWIVAAAMVLALFLGAGLYIGSSGPSKPSDLANPTTTAVANQATTTTTTLSLGEANQTLIGGIPVPISGESAVTFVDADHGWWAPTASASDTYNGVIWTTDDGGQTWSSGYEADRSVVGLDFLDDSVGWAILANLPGQTGMSQLIGTVDGGSTWQDLTDPPGELRHIDFLTASIGFGVLDETGEVVSTSDGGSTWQQLPSLPVNTQIPPALCFSNTSNGWVASGSAVATTSDGGQQWSKHSVLAAGIEVAPSADALWCYGDDVWVEIPVISQAGQPTYVLLHSSDGGTSWIAVANGGHVPLETEVGTIGSYLDGFQFFGNSSLGLITTSCEACASPTLTAWTSDNDGRSFTHSLVANVPTGSSVEVQGVASAGSDGWVLLQGAETSNPSVPVEVQQSTNEGAAWSQLSTELPSSAQ